MTDNSAQAIAFRRLPLIVQLAALLMPYIAWVLVAEFIIDRHGLDIYLPLYRVGNLCLYDAVLATALGALWWRLRRD